MAVANLVRSRNYRVIARNDFCPIRPQRRQAAKCQGSITTEAIGSHAIVKIKRTQKVMHCLILDKKGVKSARMVFYQTMMLPMRTICLYLN